MQNAQARPRAAAHLGIARNTRGGSYWLNARAGARIWRVICSGRISCLVAPLLCREFCAQQKALLVLLWRVRERTPGCHASLLILIGMAPVFVGSELCWCGLRAMRLDLGALCKQLLISLWS